MRFSDIFSIMRNSVDIGSLSRNDLWERTSLNTPVVDFYWSPMCSSSKAIFLKPLDFYRKKISIFSLPEYYEIVPFF